MEGGAPAGIRIRPGEDGCLMTRRRMRRMTRHGNNKTKPKGIEIEEFPLNLIRRLKNANFGITRPFSLGVSSRGGMMGAAGIRFARRFMNPIAADISRPTSAGRRDSGKGVLCYGEEMGRSLRKSGKIAKKGQKPPAKASTPQVSTTGI
jgi:hypothetical protein